MLKKFSKFLLIMLVMFVISSSSLICFADEEHNHEQTSSTTTTETNEEISATDDTTQEPEIHTGDLYIFDNNIVMDKYVDGNVFLFGNNVEITGTVNGNLFVFANKVNFNKSIVRYSIFACANSVYYNGGCGSYSDYGILYVAANNFEATYDSYVTGDIKAVASNAILKAAIYRDVDLISNNINLGEGTDIPNVYGNFRYTSNNEVTIPEGIMLGNGSVTYTKPSEINNTISSITDIIITFLICIVTTSVIYVITNKICPKLIEKISTEEFSFIKLLKAFVIGIVSIISFSIVFILLLISTVGANLAFILALLFAILCIIATPVLAIKITNILKPVLKIEKTSMFYLVLALVSIVLYGITYIPFVGALIGFIINITSIGLIINVFLPHKELTEEEKLAIEEAKKIKLENKEKRKLEKLEAKATKKQEKQNKENE